MPRNDDFDDVSVPLGPLDKMYRDTNIVILVIFGICCNFIAFVLSLVAYLTGKDPQAKSKAMTVLIISGIMFVIGLILNLSGALMGPPR